MIITYSNGLTMIIKRKTYIFIFSLIIFFFSTSSHAMDIFNFILRMPRQISNSLKSKNKEFSQSENNVSYNFDTIDCSAVYKGFPSFSKQYDAKDYEKQLKLYVKNNKDIAMHAFYYCYKKALEREKEQNSAKEFCRDHTAKEFGKNHSTKANTLSQSAWCGDHTAKENLIEV